MRRPTSLALLLLGALLACCCSAQANEAQSLLTLKASISNWDAFASGNDISGWEAGSDPCSWDGVTCTDNGWVTELELVCVGGKVGMCNTRAEGGLPEDLANLTRLELLSLAGQSLSGGLPEAWGEPGAFPALAGLWLNDNALNGSIPEAWGLAGAFPALEALQLSGNQLCGAVPADLQAKLLCPEGAAKCTAGSLPACPRPQKLRAVCDAPPLPRIPSWAKAYDPFAEPKQAQIDEYVRNRRLVRAANAARQQYDFIMYGDSITAHMGERFSGVWDEYFGRWAAAPLGILGNNVEEFSWRVMVGEEKFAVGPKVVVLNIGINNLEYFPLEETEAHLDVTLQYLRATWPQTRFILQNLLPNVFLDVKEANRRWRALARKHGFEWSTCGADIDPRDKRLLYDGIHPNFQGYRQIFECLQPQVAAALEREPCTPPPSD